MTSLDPAASVSALALLLFAFAAVCVVLTRAPGGLGFGLGACGAAMGVAAFGFGAGDAGWTCLVLLGPVLTVIWMAASAHLGRRPQGLAAPRPLWRWVAWFAAGGLGAVLCVAGLDMPAMGAARTPETGASPVIPTIAMAGVALVAGLGVWSLLAGPDRGAPTTERGKRL